MWVLEQSYIPGVKPGAAFMSIIMEVFQQIEIDYITKPLDILHAEVKGNCFLEEEKEKFCGEGPLFPLLSHQQYIISTIMDIGNVFLENHRSPWQNKIRAYENRHEITLVPCSH